MAKYLFTVVGVSTGKGERFFVGARTAGEIVGTSGALAAEDFPPVLSSPVNEALAEVGIVPYKLMEEPDLRRALAAMGLTDEMIKTQFAEARKWMTSIRTLGSMEH